MGWSIYYKAKVNSRDLQEFLKSANAVQLNLSENCESYFWEVNGKSAASGFTKVEFAKTPEQDFIVILKEIKSLSEKWPKAKIEVSDDYYLEGVNISKVDVENIFEKDEEIPSKSSEPFDFDNYVYEFEIKYDLTKRLEEVLTTCTNLDLCNRTLKSIELWKECGAEEIFARKYMFDDYIEDVDSELIFLRVPDDIDKRSTFFQKISNLYGNVIALPAGRKLLPTHLIKFKDVDSK